MRVKPSRFQITVDASMNNYERLIRELQNRKRLLDSKKPITEEELEVVQSAEQYAAIALTNALIEAGKVE